MIGLHRIWFLSFTAVIVVASSAAPAYAADPGTICISGGDIGIATGYDCGRRDTREACLACVKDRCGKYTQDITWAWIESIYGDVFDSFRSACEATASADCPDQVAVQPTPEMFTMSSTDLTQIGR